MLTKAELDSRHHIYLEQFVKQITIEGQTLLSMARTLVLPAAMRHQSDIAEAVASAEMLDIDCTEQRETLEEFVELASRLKRCIGALDHALFADHASDVRKHAVLLRDKVRPAIEALRESIDEVERRVADDLWPIPTYREMLFIR